MESLREQLRTIKELPSLSDNVLRLLNALADPTLGRETIERIVAADPALSIAMLRVANSATHAGEVEVDTIGDAVMRVGFQALKKIAIAHYCQSVASGGRGFGLHRESAWVGAYGGAVAAEVIARRTPGVNADVCYTAALLRDCGKLAMDLLVGAESLSAEMCRPTGDLSQIEFERETFGFDHATVGGELAALWGLPNNVRDAIRFHHDPPVAALPEVGVVHVADALTTMLGLGLGHDGLGYPLDESRCLEAGLEVHDFERVMVEVVQRRAEALVLLES